MAEKEKMMKRAHYGPNHDKGLIQERCACKDLCHEYGLIAPSRPELRLLYKPGIPLSQSAGTPGWNTPTRLPWGTMCGLAAASTSCRRYGSNVVTGGIVVKDIPDNVAAGNPCRVLRPVTEEGKFETKKCFITSSAPFEERRITSMDI